MFKKIVLLFVLLLVLQSVSAEDNETADNQSVEPQTQKPGAGVCDPDCRIGDSCVEEGVQKQEGDVLYYCGYGNKAFPAKADDEVCSADYECMSYDCKDGYCGPLVAAEPEDTEEPIWASVVIVVVIFGVAFLLFKFGLKSKGVSKAEKKKAEKKEAWEESVKGIKQSHYTYKPELDVLERKLKEKLKK